MRLITRGRGATSTARTLRQLREELGASQADLAVKLETSQPAVLKTENASDPRLSTVRRYVEALARIRKEPWEVVLVATIGDRTSRIAMPEPLAADAHADLNESGDRRAEDMIQGRGVEHAAAWRLRAWDDRGLEAAWLARGVISMGSDEIGDLSEWPGGDVLGRRLTAALPDRGSQAIGMFVTYWRYFCLEMAVGDVVVVPLSSKRAGIALITGPYRYHGDEPEPKLRHQRCVEWVRTVHRSMLDDDIRKVVNAPGTVCRIGAPGAAHRLV